MRKIMHFNFFLTFYFYICVFLYFKLQFNIPNVKINYDEQNETSVLEFLTYNEKKFSKYQLCKILKM